MIPDLTGIYVSKAKNRPAIEGFVLTLVLNPLGTLIAAVLPTKEAPAPVVKVAAKKRYPKSHPMNYYPGTKETHVGQAFQPDSEPCQAGKPDLLKTINHRDHREHRENRITHK